MIGFQRPDERVTADNPVFGEESKLRSHLHAMWAEVADGWARFAEYADAFRGELNEDMLEITAPRPGERVIELACGPAGLGLAAAKRVAPNGEVVLTDVVPEMTSIAARRAEAAGLENVSTRLVDLDAIRESNASYDVVLCSEGLMFAMDPANAAHGMFRILRAGGRLAVVVWGPRERNPWLATLMDAVSAQMGRPVPPNGMPGPFALSDKVGLASLLSNAGFANVVVSEIAVTARAKSFDEWWARTTALAGPLTQILANMPAATLNALRARTREATVQYETPLGLEFPGVALLVFARRT